MKAYGMMALGLWCYASTAFAAAAADNADTPHSTLYTNFDKQLNVQNAVSAFHVPIGIYDIGYIIYSQSFAERFGYPSEHIASLDSGMHALEFRMRTNGGLVECHLNALLDNTLELDLPEQEYVSRFEQHGDMMRFPQKLESYKDKEGWYKESDADKAFRIKVRQDKWHYYNRNTRLASYDYAPSKPGTWASSALFEGYSRQYFKDLDYVSVNIGCVEQTHTQLLDKHASLWLKKKGGDDYSLTLGTKPEQFLKFRIPPTFATRAAGEMAPYLKSKYHYFDTIEK